jgi:hypothetical protein
MKKNSLLVPALVVGGIGLVAYMATRNKEEDLTGLEDFPGGDEYGELVAAGGSTRIVVWDGTGDWVRLCYKTYPANASLGAAQLSYIAVQKGYSTATAKYYLAGHFENGPLFWQPGGYEVIMRNTSDYGRIFSTAARYYIRVKFPGYSWSNQVYCNLRPY